MSFETELRDQLHAGVDNTMVDLDELLAGGVAHGNKLVRRRRLTRIFAGAATIAVLGGAFAYAGTLGGSTNPGGTGIAPAGPAVVQGKKAAITPQAALGVLLELLPKDHQATDLRGGFDGTGTVLGVYSTMTYGNATLRLEVIKKQVPYSCDAYYPDCKVTMLPDSSKLRLLTTGYPGPSGKDDYQQLQANLSRKDGFSVNLIAVNSTPAKPAITLAQLKTIASSLEWQPKVDQALIDRSEKLFRPRLVTEPSVPS
jgi:hypothetical protein